ncbi:tRNA-queuosine alpha-mannosyltransferase isoform X2 [Tribolium castaneum]|uniref:tRNA-queuosine alpha-mannosyltransferase isoform X2 n=1 Tax=Tribolium castaneum TaxID=7070 RepID=UPI00077DCB39|nr:PREDICTED: glycosyltransferase-like domain-containing protein 1 isoform X2 [Tribolium castaneum]|eukprot:XP_015834050.1 PREDICTED: glycosyltransferase-like domain-containing protein 1 isoform X2 [Tribolium castaneum]
MNVTQCPKVLFIEPFYGGSHKALIDTFAENYGVITLPAKKWHWRARCGALSLLEFIPPVTSEKILFCSSVLNLAELLGLRPDLQPLKKIVYFHENQLIYPVRDIKERDVQYSYNQIVTCIAADVVLFNSYFNQTSFLENINKITKLLPDRRPKDLKQKIESKCQVLYFPMDFCHISQLDKVLQTNVLHIVWPHRWEFDKGPEDFFSVLMKLKEEKIPFKLSILGENFTDIPPIFTTIKLVMKEEIENFGYVQSKSDYYNILASAHVVVSTAKHEFFGVALLEAVYCGCYPLAPNLLVYPEIYPPDCLYADLEDLQNRLKAFCLDPSLVLEARKQLTIDFDKYSSKTVVPKFKQIINNLIYVFYFIQRKFLTS